MSALENFAKSAATPRGAGGSRTAARLTARSWLRSSTTRKRVRECGLASGGLVHVEGGHDHGGVSGLKTCGSVWSCPVCSAKIAYGRQVEMETGISRWADGTHGLQAGSFVLLTLTLRHHRGMSLAEVWGGLSGAWRSFVSSRRYKETLQGIGSAGYHRTTEVTYGAFGWHVHLHVLYFLEGRPADLTAAAAGGVLTAHWVDSVGKHGFSAVPDAQDWKVLRGSSKALMAIAGYVHKGEYVEGASYAREAGGVAMEITRSDLKAGRGSRTPFEILAGLVEGTSTDPVGDSALWAEWEAASSGRRQQVWSRGMRARLGLDAELSDEDLAELDDEAADRERLVTITASEWRKIANRPGGHSTLLSIIDSAPTLREATDDLCVWLDSIGVDYIRVYR